MKDQLPSAELIDMFPKEKKQRFCSFCKTKESEAKRMFTNNGTGDLLRNICDKCVSIAYSKIHPEQTDNKPKDKQ
jgi:RNase P subunit RPR2